MVRESGLRWAKDGVPGKTHGSSAASGSEDDNESSIRGKCVADTGGMFHLRRLAVTAIEERIARSGERPAPSVRFLSLTDGVRTKELEAFAHDESRSRLGFGRETFAKAKWAFARWQMFDLGWVRVANTSASIGDGQIVAVEVHALGLWSVNLSQIRDTVDTETEFGFIYATTEEHIEEGEESFVVRLDPLTGEVIYELEAFSRPRHPLARIGFPMTRFFQHRFARDSHGRMRQAVNLNV